MHTGNYADSPRIIPEEKHKAFPPPAKTLPRVKKSGVPGVDIHPADFLRACKEGYQPASTFDYAGPLSEMVLLGCLAIRAGVGKPVVLGRGQPQGRRTPRAGPPDPPEVSRGLDAVIWRRGKGMRWAARSIPDLSFPTPR